MGKKYEIFISMFLLIVILLISSCSALGKTDEFGCFPPSCSLKEVGIQGLLYSSVKKVILSAKVHKLLSRQTGVQKNS